MTLNVPLRPAFALGAILAALAVAPSAMASHQFTDVPDGAPFHAEIGIFKDTNITTGCTATTFCPSNTVLRQAMAAFFVRALGLVPRPGEAGLLKGVPGSRVAMIDDNLSFVGTGSGANVLRYTGPNDNVAGGSSVNVIGTEVTGGTIAGGGALFGDANRVHGGFGSIGGGLNNTVGDDVATAGDGYATIGGGKQNFVGRQFGTIAGGNNNSTETSSYSSIGGGLFNNATGTAATIGGGAENTASGLEATVGGGLGNTALGFYSSVPGGETNTASGSTATVGGGRFNTASGSRSTVAGGDSNDAAGDYSFAAGRRAQADHDGAFVWADSTDADFASTATNQFNTRARGGYRFLADTGGCTIAANGTMACPQFTGVFVGTCACTVVSDRAAKRAIAPVDRRALLRRLARIPITSWSYRTERNGVRHLGPMAQDFRAAFGLGADGKQIATVDADGVALAAIQALDADVRALQRENAKLKRQNTRLAALERAVASLSKR